MASRRVRRTGKDRDGDITALCDGGGDWGRVSKADAIRHLDNETHTYYVNEDGSRVGVGVIREPGKAPFLRTTADKTSKNNLENLPNC